MLVIFCSFSIDLSILYMIVTLIDCSFKHYFYYMKKLVIYRHDMKSRLHYFTKLHVSSFLLYFFLLGVAIDHKVHGTKLSKVQSIYAASKCHMLDPILVTKIDFSRLAIEVYCPQDLLSLMPAYKTSFYLTSSISCKDISLHHGCA